MTLSTDDIRSWIDADYTRKDKAEPRQIPLRLSSINACPRKQAVLLREPVKRQLEPKRLRVFETGHQRGEALAKAIIPSAFESGYACETEREVWAHVPMPASTASAAMDRFRNDDTWDLEGLMWKRDVPFRLTEEGYLELRGRADLVIWRGELTEDPYGNQQRQFWVVDFKTKHPFGFKKLETEGVDADYVAQVVAYARAIESEPPVDGVPAKCMGCFVAYEAHDTRDIKVLPVEYDCDLADRNMVQVAHLLRSYAANGPIQEFKAVYAQESKWVSRKEKTARLPWQCNYCSVGPVLGQCLPNNKVTNKTKVEGAPSSWEIEL